VDVDGENQLCFLEEAGAEAGAEENQFVFFTFGVGRRDAVFILYCV
jgi:hypothetical protein